VSTYEDEDETPWTSGPAAAGPPAGPDPGGKAAAGRLQAEWVCALVPLGNVVTYAMSTTPSEINRQDLNPPGGDHRHLDGLPLGTAVKKVEEASKKLTLASGVPNCLSGEAEDMAESSLHGRSPDPGHHLRVPDPGRSIRVFH